MSLVSEAIGSTAESFLLNSTSRVSWSITRATLDLRSSCVLHRVQAGQLAVRTGGPATATTRTTLSGACLLANETRPRARACCVA